jgi:cobalt/nickel transport system ATP-binding protein
VKPMIEIDALSYSYPDGTRALESICLSVMPGEKIALVGANGAGKSTLLLHLNGVLTGEGSVCISGLALEKKNIGRIRAMVGLVFQNPDDQLFSSTVYEDVAFGPIHQGYDDDVIKEKVSDALKAVQMTEFADRNPYHLSSGQKKRVAIASVLSMRPEVLAFDEPSAGLDPRARRELIELLEELPQTMLIATHDLDLANRLAPRTVLLNAGRIVKDGFTEAILGNSELLYANGMR